MNTAAPTLFRLIRPSKALDRRVNAARGDVADIALAGKIFVPHYVEPCAKSVISERAPVLHKPSVDAVTDSELVRGEGFAVLDISGGWAWGYCLHDHYVGYVHTNHLGDYAVQQQQPIVADYVDTALTFVGTPYLWGGRSLAGIDCSGLVQVSLARAGLAVPRDADQQMHVIGSAMGADEPARRGDIIFFPHHVGIMIDDTHMVHATGFRGAVVVEPLADVVARIAEKHATPILARRRLV